MSKMKYWNGSQWATLDAANADTLAGNTLAQVRAGTTKANVGLSDVDNVKQMPIAGGTFTGQANAQSNTAYTTAQIRNISMGTADPSGGSNGDVYLQYE